VCMELVISRIWFRGGEVVGLAGEHLTMVSSLLEI
jgi:hypothetical protein